MQEGCRTREQKVVESEIPDGGESLPKGDECACSPNNSPSDNVPMVMKLINRKGSSDQHRTENGREEQYHFPVRRIVRTDDLQLGVKVQGKEDEASKCGSRVARRERLEGIINRFLVAGAY